MSWLHPIRTLRRRRAAARPFPTGWERILARHVLFERRLPARDRDQLRRRIQVFLSEKRFEGVGGLHVTDEIRVTVAAHASLLRLHRDDDDYPLLTSILVYPGAYRVHTREHGAFGMVTEADQVRLGEAWVAGTVVLSWEDARRGTSDQQDGHNVLLHEFAHQLDMEDRDANGAPLLPTSTAYRDWAGVLGREFERLQDQVSRQHPTLIDAYGAESPAEFFAVVTETFFERPTEMRAGHPELYGQLRAFYQLDPASWDGASPAVDGVDEA